MRHRYQTLAVVAILLSVMPSSLAFGTDGPPDDKQGNGGFIVNGCRIYYEERGTGPCVVLLHDGLVHASSWDGIWDALGKKFHVVRYDRRGYGRSDIPKAPFSPTEDLAAILAHVHQPRATLVGCSSGAGLALDFAIEHPDQVEQLILIGPVVHGMATSAHFYARGEKNNAPLRKGDVKATAENWSKDRYQIAGNHEAARKALYEALLHYPHNLQYPGKFEVRSEPPAVDRLAEIRVPTLILVGEHDIPDVHAYSGAIEVSIWGARREVIQDAGHLIALEQPDRVSKIITRFVEKYKAVRVPKELLEIYAGSYKMHGGVRQLVIKDGRLALREPRERDVPLFASSEAKFFSLVGTIAEYEFVRDATGKVTRLDLREFGAVRRCERVAART
jgi:3-oxoadipate enol-lactonase